MRVFKYFLILILTSCVYYSTDDFNSDAEVSELFKVEYSEGRDIDVFFNVNINLAKYEPSSGIYIGAYVDYGILDRFEEDTDREHDIYIYYMNIMDDFPRNFILNIVSLDKIPYLIIDMDGSNFDYVDNLLDDLRIFNIPMFLEVVNVDDRILSYLIARLPNNIAFVSNYANPLGVEHADWISFTYIAEIDEYGVPIYSHIDIFDEFDRVYAYFQDRKPIMFNFAVNNFHSASNRYLSVEASEEITRIYETLIGRYPRVKAISYLNFKNSSVLESSLMLYAYRAAISDVTASFDYDVSYSGLIRSQFYGYVLNGIYHISRESLLYEFGIEVEYDYVDINLLPVSFFIEDARIVLDLP